MSDDICEGQVSSLGSGGDGIVEGADGPVFIPYTLPGETLRFTRHDNRGRLVELLQPSLHRTSPGCRHFTCCGGCTLQHMAPGAYLHWKRELVQSAFRARDIDIRVDEVQPVGAASRRRCVFTARRTRKQVILGFHVLRSDDIVEIDGCLILHPEIAGALEGLKELSAPLLSRRGQARVHVLNSLSGLDVAIENVKPVDSAPLCAQLALIADRLDLARVSVDGEIILTRREPVVVFGGVQVVPPPGAFLQAAEESQSLMTSLVVQGCGAAVNIADLFAGIGTFSFPLAQRAAVTAVEFDPMAVGALEHAARHAQRIKPMQVIERDLFKDPLSVNEMALFDAVIFDPPRAGARAQAECLAASDIGLVVAVSCNPTSLARDARILIDGGYEPVRVTPVDQFLYTSHIEVIAQFKRG